MTGASFRSTGVLAKTPEILGFYAWRGNWPVLCGTEFPRVDPSTNAFDLITRVPAVWFSIDENGDLVTNNDYALRPNGWETVIRECGRHQVPVDMTVAYLDGPRLEEILADQARVDRMVSAIVREVKPFAGVNLDLEGLGNQSRHDDRSLARVRSDFNRLVQQLAGELAPRGKTLYLCLHPVNSWFKGYDYAALAGPADALISMSYHYGPTPEPLDKVEDSVRLALKTGVPPEKLILGLLMLRPYETPESVGAKLSLVGRYRLGGIAVWKLSFINKPFRRVLRHWRSTGR
ncbi:MAG: glycosyl hydrolase family 18 protein [Bacillota bacterium]